MNILDFAVQKEKYSEEYYRKLAEQTGSKGMQNIFTMLADEEVKHYQTVRQLKNAVPESIANTDLLTDAKGVFRDMKGSKDKFDFSDSEIETYRKAQDIEKQSRDFYLQKASELQDNNQKRIFEQLAEEEKKHFFLLDNIIEFVSRPETWLENAEFHHLEEY